MAEKKMNPAAMVILIIIILVALFFIIKQAMPKKSAAPEAMPPAMEGPMGPEGIPEPESPAPEAPVE